MSFAKAFAKKKLWMQMLHDSCSNKASIIAQKKRYQKQQRPCVQMPFAVSFIDMCGCVISKTCLYIYKSTFGIWTFAAWCGVLQRFWYSPNPFLSTTRCPRFFFRLPQTTRRPTFPQQLRGGERGWFVGGPLSPRKFGIKFHRVLQKDQWLVTLFYI